MHESWQWVGTVFTRKDRFRATCWGCEWEQVTTGRAMACEALVVHLRQQHATGWARVVDRQWHERASVYFYPSVCWELWVDVEKTAEEVAVDGVQT